jgi:hypothetical protein
LHAAVFAAELLLPLLLHAASTVAATAAPTVSTDRLLTIEFVLPVRVRVKAVSLRHLSSPGGVIQGTPRHRYAPVTVTTHKAHFAR